MRKKTKKVLGITISVLMIMSFILLFYFGIRQSSLYFSFTPVHEESFSYDGVNFNFKSNYEINQEIENVCSDPQGSGSEDKLYTYSSMNLDKSSLSLLTKQNSVEFCDGSFNRAKAYLETTNLEINPKKLEKIEIKGDFSVETSGFVKATNIGVFIFPKNLSNPLMIAQIGAEGTRFQEIKDIILTPTGNENEWESSFSSTDSYYPEDEPITSRKVILKPDETYELAFGMYLESTEASKGGGEQEASISISEIKIVSDEEQEEEQEEEEEEEEGEEGEEEEQEEVKEKVIPVVFIIGFIIIVLGLITAIVWKLRKR